MDGQTVGASTSTPHGQKRRAEDDLNNEQRLTKRFDLLNLEQNGKLYVPVSHGPSTRTPRSIENNESMDLDDTKDKVYIYNLDDELSDIEDEDEKLMFLPDIERKLAKIPKSVLTGEAHPSTGKQMVLYSVPTSLSVPEDQDKVRKAIIESRSRAREKQVHDAEMEVARARSPGRKDITNGTKNDEVIVDEEPNLEEDEDAMDLG